MESTSVHFDLDAIYQINGACDARRQLCETDKCEIENAHNFGRATVDWNRLTFSNYVEGSTKDKD
jgi:hypothetical protein